MIWPGCQFAGAVARKNFTVLVRGVVARAFSHDMSCGSLIRVYAKWGMTGWVYLGAAATAGWLSVLTIVNLREGVAGHLGQHISDRRHVYMSAVAASGRGIYMVRMKWMRACGGGGRRFVGWWLWVWGNGAGGRLASHQGREMCERRGIGARSVQ